MGSLHCLGMCGPITFMLPVSRSQPLRGMGQVMVYHLGRLTAYGLIGLLFGMLGKGLALFGMQQKVSIGIGILMILTVLIPWRIPSRMSLTKPLYLGVSRIKNHLASALAKRSTDTFLTIGFLNGLLPCGLVYMALLGAIAMGNAPEGALFMALFGLGTVPMMTAAVYLGNFAKASVRQKIQAFIPAVLVLIGILFILRGLGLGIPYLSPAPVLNLSQAPLECMP